MVYTGERKDRPKWLSLADEFFDGDGRFLEGKVRILYGEGKDDIISQYVDFTKVCKEQTKQYGRTRKAIQETIRICKDRNVLREYLESREKEVADIVFTLFDEEEVYNEILEAEKEEARAEGREKGREEGRAEGRVEGREEGRAEGRVEAREESRKELAARMHGKGYSDKTIAELLEISLKKVQDILYGNAPAAK